MKKIELDMHGVHFVTDKNLPGFMTRGALQDRADLPYGHLWSDQGPAFDQHADEIEAFAHLLMERGYLQSGHAVITPAHVQFRPK